MGASTFWTQRQLMARAGTTDPQQVMVQKLLLYVLPLSFAVSGVFFPIGVLLYWLTTNVWSMGQQAYVIKRMPPPVLDGKPVEGKDTPPGKDGPKGGGTGKGGGVRPASPSSGTPGDTGDTGDAPPARTTSAGSSPGSSAGGSRVVAPASRRAAGSRKNKRRSGRR
jgi:YidC/Oxa1 family membrane protein insertase